MSIVSLVVLVAFVFVAHVSSYLTLIYMRRWGKFAHRQFFCYSSKMVGARLLKLCGFYC